MVGEKHWCGHMRRCGTIVLFSQVLHKNRISRSQLVIAASSFQPETTIYVATTVAVRHSIHRRFTRHTDMNI